LIDHADPGPDLPQLARGEMGDILAVEKNKTAARLKNSQDETQDCRLPIPL
jgi:hypothetical protein